MNNPKETFQHVRDFLCQRNGIVDYSTAGVGWTLHDSVYAVSSSNISINDYFVIYSAGEDGNRQLYFKFTYTSGNINVVGYLYWNNSTHTGVQMYGGTSTWTNTLDTNNILSIYADLDAVLCIAKYSATYQAHFHGWCPDSRRSTTVTTIGSSISSSTSVTVTFAGGVPAGWAVGKRVFMYDNANIERVEITGISGNDVTFTKSSTAYASGAKFIMEDTYYCTSSNGGSWYRRIGNNGTKNDVSGAWTAYAPAVTVGDPLDAIPYPAFNQYLVNTTSIFGPVKNFLLAPTGFTSETTHTVDGVQHKFFYLSSGWHSLVKDE